VFEAKRRKGGCALGGAHFAMKRLALFELELERLAEEESNPLGIQPGCGAGLADEGDSAAHAKLRHRGL
jgi:hypothetical protein